MGKRLDGPFNIFVIDTERDRVHQGRNSESHDAAIGRAPVLIELTGLHLALGTMEMAATMALAFNAIAAVVARMRALGSLAAARTGPSLAAHALAIETHAVDRTF